jgi:HD-GYP domain-containing protein (c-di-GMP phosphodiesterase class II)
VKGHPASGASEHLERVQLLIKALLTVVKTRGFYPMRHPTVTVALGDLMRMVEALLERRSETSITVVGCEIVVDGRPLPRDSLVLDRFREMLEAHEVERITLLRGMGPEEGEALVEALATPPELVRARGGVAELLSAQGVRSVLLGRLLVAEGVEPARARDPWSAAEETWRIGLRGIQALSEKVRTDREIDGGAVLQIASLLLDGLRDKRGPMLAALALRQKSAYTFSHSINVALLMLAQVEMLELAAGQLAEVIAAGLLHDIGKLLIPDAILEKPAALDPQEWAMVRRHPVYGLELLGKVPELGDVPLIVAFEHHMRHDASGYPTRRSAEPCQMLSSIAMIADCYDAMRSHRPYDKPQSCEEVYRRMNELSGLAFHPELLDRFFRIVGMYPPGSTVRLSTGILGKVVRNHPAWHDRPVVQILREASEPSPTRPWLFDLAVDRELHGPAAASIVASLPEA